MPLQPAVLGPNTRLNNFRLNYLTAAQAADRPTHIRVILGGIDITKPDAPMRVIYKSMQIRDALFEAPNTCACTIYGAAPNVGQSLEVWVNSNAPVLLFGGELQTVEKTYKGRPATVLHPVTAIDDTARANRRRPLRPYVNQSASLIALDLITTFAPGFSTNGVEAGLPAVSINFDGSEGGMKGCLTALAKLVGGYWFFEAKTLYFFVTPPGTPPDPIDDTPHRFLHDPAITWTIDKSQVRTRVYGKGASSRIAASIAIGETIVPLDNAEMFNAAGGQAIAGATPDGAASRILTYTATQRGGGGGLVGPGSSPSATPNLLLRDGAGLLGGVYKYGYTFTTATGESLISPINTITTGLVTPPASAPLPGAVQVGGAVEPATHYYALTFVTAAGETTGGPQSAPATTTAAAPLAAPAAPGITAANNFQPHLPGGTYYYACGYQTVLGSTLPGPPSVGWMQPTIPADQLGPGPLLNTDALRSPDPRVTAINIYRTVAGGAPTALRFLTTAPNSGPAAHFIDTGTIALGANAPTVDTSTGANYQTVPLTGLAIGPANVTARRLYRHSGAGYKLLTTIPNNTQTTYTDTTASAGLSGTLPASNTAVANQVDVIVAIGGAGVTGRKVYRSGSGGAGLYFLATIPDNTTQTIRDAAPDGALGALAPTADSSGLVQPNGQVPAGSTAVIVANTAAFADTGGWAVVGNGEVGIRYTAKTANGLTGIPATGPGALVASVAYNSTITAAPALIGVTGVVDAVIRNAPIHVWVQRDDLAAQAYMAALDGSGDGVYEHIWSDERRTEASLIQVCDAQLELYSRPLVTVTYATRDLKTKSGKTVTIALTTPAIHESLTIQDVAISELGIKGLAPKFTVTASTVRQSFEAILQSLIRKADA